ncbi:MAG: hypothetical protein KME54_28900 [Tolypothrix brevis GSE-NOS-MK-07-07A]|jgi:hypothetical protein|nr:hypothetical protein [Tolypothrix brevis GSE-NOS-MK-07-07A]
MSKILSLENGSKSTKLFLVYYATDTYVAVNVTGLSKGDAIARLPSPTPNFIYQSARSSANAIALVKNTQAESLLSSPL